MANFCKFCGNGIGENQLCDCPAAVADRAANSPIVSVPPAVAAPVVVAPPVVVAAPVVVAPPVQPVAPQQPVPPQGYGSYTPGQQQAPPQGYQPQQPIQPGQQQPGQPYPPQEQHGQSFQMPPQISQAAGQVSGSMKTFLKNPFHAMETASSGSMTNGLILIGINALAFSLFWMLSIWRISGDFLPFSMSFLNPFLTILIGCACLFAIIFIGGKLFAGKMQPNGLINIIGFSTIPWTASLLVSLVLVLILADMGSAPLYIIGFLLLCVLSLSPMLLERGLRVMLPSDKHRMLIIAIALAIHYIVGFRVFSAVMERSMGGMMRGYW